MILMTTWEDQNYINKINGNDSQKILIEHNGKSKTGRNTSLHGQVLMEKQADKLTIS